MNAQAKNEKHRMVAEAYRCLSAHNDSDVIVTKAVRKAERWMRAAYGGVDWIEYSSEVGRTGLNAFIQDTLDHSDGKATFNRESKGGGK